MRSTAFFAVLSNCAIACAVTDDAPAPAMRRASAAPDHGKVALCHVAGSEHHSVVVAAAAIEAHLGHGDAVGECASGCTAESCSDGDACTTDVCMPDGTCSHAAVDCNDGNGCTIDACDPVGGCVAATAEGNACDDGNECTDDDVCCLDACRGTPVAGCCLDASDCDDANACSDDACVDGACSNTPVECADADPCVVGFCDPTTGECDGAPLDCNDGNPYTIDSCGDDGCAHASNEGQSLHVFAFGRGAYYETSTKSSMTNAGTITTPTIVGTSHGRRLRNATKPARSHARPVNQSATAKAAKIAK
jgi:hypothetical protein